MNFTKNHCEKFEQHLFDALARKTLVLSKTMMAQLAIRHLGLAGANGAEGLLNAVRTQLVVPVVRDWMRQGRLLERESDPLPEEVRVKTFEWRERGKPFDEARFSEAMSAPQEPSWQKPPASRKTVYMLDPACRANRSSDEEQQDPFRKLPSFEDPPDWIKCQRALYAYASYYIHLLKVRPEEAASWCHYAGPGRDDGLPFAEIKSAGYRFVFVVGPWARWWWKVVHERFCGMLKYDLVLSNVDTERPECSKTVEDTPQAGGPLSPASTVRFAELGALMSVVRLGEQMRQHKGEQGKKPHSGVPVRRRA